MNLRQLEYVVALNEHRNFRRAAFSAGISQSALTQSIKQLEAEYGVALFKRDTRELLVRQRTMLINAIRAHSAEFGMIAAQGMAMSVTFSSGRCRPGLRLCPTWPRSPWR